MHATCASGIYMSWSVLASMIVVPIFWCLSFFFFNDTATTEIYTLSLHDALPICMEIGRHVAGLGLAPAHQPVGGLGGQGGMQIAGGPALSIPLGNPAFMRDPEHMRQVRIQR